MNALSNRTHSPSAQISIDGAAIHNDRHGRFCLNDLHQASGGERKNQPQYFLDNVKTQELVQELITTGIPVLPVEVINGGNNRGTYVVKQIVYAYAMWISAKFHLKVINTFDSATTQAQLPDLNNPAQLRDLLLAMLNKTFSSPPRIKFSLKPLRQSHQPSTALSFNKPVRF